MRLVCFFSLGTILLFMVELSGTCIENENETHAHTHTSSVEVVKRWRRHKNFWARKKFVSLSLFFVCLFLPKRYHVSMMCECALCTADKSNTFTMSIQLRDELTFNVIVMNWSESFLLPLRNHTNNSHLKCRMLIWWIYQIIYHFSDKTQNAKSICAFRKPPPHRSMRQKMPRNFSDSYLWLMRVYSCTMFVTCHIDVCVCVSVNGLYTMPYIGQTFLWLHSSKRTVFAMRGIYTSRECSQHTIRTLIFCWLDYDQKRWRKMSICQSTGRWICRKWKRNDLCAPMHNSSTSCTCLSPSLMCPIDVGRCDNVACIYVFLSVGTKRDDSRYSTLKSNAYTISTCFTFHLW